MFHVKQLKFIIMSRRNFTTPPNIMVESQPCDVQRQPDLLDDFVYEPVKNDDGSYIHLFYDQSTVISDVSFAQRLTPQNMQILVDRMNATKRSADALAALRSKLTDDQLLDTIKSRYIQRPADLIAFMDGINSDYNVAAQEVLDQINNKSETEEPQQVTNQEGGE